MATHDEPFLDRDGQPYPDPATLTPAQAAIWRTEAADHAGALHREDSMLLSVMGPFAAAALTGGALMMPDKNTAGAGIFVLVLGLVIVVVLSLAVAPAKRRRDRLGKLSVRYSRRATSPTPELDAPTAAPDRAADDEGEEDPEARVSPEA